MFSKGKKDKAPQTAGEKAFKWLNYGGLGFIANSSLSLLITYKAMPTEFVQKNIVANIQKGMEPIVGGLTRAFTKDPEKLAKSMKYVPDKARSATEILMMFVAGCTILIPMKLMEDRKEAIVNNLNRVLPNNGKKDSTEAIEVTAEGTNGKTYIQPEDEKQTWGNLLKARLMSMGIVLGVDQGIESINNTLNAAGHTNIDELEWKLGKEVFDTLPKGAQEGFIRFFNENGAGIEKIQPMVQERLKKTVGQDTKSVVFAEQTRFFSKEISLTVVIATLMYLFSNKESKAPCVPEKDFANSLPSQQEKTSSWEARVHSEKTDKKVTNSHAEAAMRSKSKGETMLSVPV